MAKKFTELLPIEALTNDDIIAIVDDGSSNSRKITAEQISDYVYKIEVVGDSTNLASIKQALNGSNNTSNGLRASQLFHQGLYRDSSYFLNYNNLDGRPATILNNGQLVNTENYTSLKTETGAQRASLRVRDASGSGASPAQVTADHIAAGVINQFYTDTKVNARIDAKFGDLFNQYSSTFDGGNTQDSLEDVKAEWVTDTNSATTSQIIKITDPEELTLNAYKVGQVLRVYGGHRPLTGVPTVALSSAPSATVNAENGAFILNPSASSKLTLKYKLAYFDLRNGRIGPRSTTGTFDITLTTQTETTTVQDIRNAFNTSNFVSFNIDGAPSNVGLLVYRQEGGSGAFELVSIAGPKDTGNNSGWRDYYNFDFTDWSGKNPDNNAFLPEQDKLIGGRSVIHFPQQLAAGSLNDGVTYVGWSDVSIKTVGDRNAGGEFRLEINEDDVIINGTADKTCYLMHNDTNKLQSAIDSKAEKNQRSLNLNAKTYNVSHIRMPSKFGLTGVTGITKIKKLPHSGFISGTGSYANYAIQGVASGDGFGTELISLIGIDFDGNNRNQYLLGEDNTFIDFGVQSTGCLIQNCRIRNLVGEGINASSPTEFKLLTSEIADSGVTDRHEFSPLTIDDGINTIVTGNIIQNFTNFIDASVTRQGVITNNVIKNLTGNIQDGEEETDLGSAIFTYGSTFLLSSPNVLMGPSNEFLSAPDILNSEYDAVNILRSNLQQQANSPAGYYTSDEFVYQENGTVFDLSQDSVNETQGGTVLYRTNLIRKLGNASNSAEEVYGNLVGPGARDIRNNEFSAPQVQNFGLVQDETYEIVDVGNTDWSRIGAIGNIAGQSFVYNGQPLYAYDGTNTNSTLATTGTCSPGYAVGYVDRGLTPVTFAIITNGVVAGADNSLNGLVVGDKVSVGFKPNGATGSPDAVPGVYAVTAVNGNGTGFTVESGVGDGNTAHLTMHKVGFQPRIQFNNILTDVARDRGQFKFEITNAVHGSLNRLLTGAYSAGELDTIYSSQIRASESDSSRIHPPNSYHVGVAWSANYRYHVEAGTFSTTGSWEYELAAPNNFGHRNLDSNGKDHTGFNMNRTTENDPQNAGRGYRDFYIKIANPKYVTLGKKVYIAKTGFSRADFNSYGIIVTLEPDTATTTDIVVRFFAKANPYATSSTDGSFTSGLSGPEAGKLSIIDDFILSQGLIK